MAHAPVLFLVSLLAATPSRTPTAVPAVPGADEAKSIIAELVACGTRHSLSSWTDPRRGAGCGRDAVLKRFRAIPGGKLKIVVDEFQTMSARTKNQSVHMENVYAILPGTDPARTKTAVVVSGHFDSMPTDIMDPAADAPGADDDASGVAVSILSAKALAARPVPYRATLVFAAVSGEEQGLLGSRRMKEWLEQQGYAVGGMITNDIVGATNGSKDRRPRVFSEGGPDGIDSPSREMARLAEELVGKDKVRLVFRRDRFGRGGDHIPFIEGGLPAIRFCEPLEVYAHEHQTPRTENGVEYGDLVKFLDFDFIAEVAAANQRVLADLADAPAPPAAVTLTGAVTPSARITTEGGEDAERQSFEILFRETTDTRWTHFRTADKPGEEVLENIRTDNEYFAVRSVGKNGAKSLAIPAVASVRRPPGYVPANPTPAVAPTPAATRTP